MDLDELRDANQKRAKLWGNKTGIEFAMVELAGEVGELANEIKKRRRQELGMAGGKDDAQAIADELADVVICADLLAAKLGVDLSDAVRNKFNSTSQKHGFDVLI